MSEPPVPYPPKATAWYATIVLAVLIWLSVLDRFIISLLVGPIKRDLGISDVQFGVLNGFAFSVTYAVFGLALGFLADRYSRRWIIYAGVSFWSLATAACGLAQVYWQLVLARVGVGAGEATLGPGATSLLADLFPRERLTTAMSVFHVGTTVGAGMAYIIGGAGRATRLAHADLDGAADRRHALLAGGVPRRRHSRRPPLTHRVHVR